MEDFQQLAPDAEVFARVWARVMPDADAGPIAVHRPGNDPTPPPRPEPEGPRPPRDDESILRRLLEEMDEGLARGSEMARRTPRARAMWESLQHSARQLRSAWFLLTGRRWQPGRPRPEPRGELNGLIRRQYMWEIGFSRQCRDAGRALRAEDLREIMPGLEAQSIRRRGMLRQMLE